MIAEVEQETLEDRQNGNRIILTFWLCGMGLMLFLGWLNFSVNARLSAAEQFAETFPITTEACLIPQE